MRDLNTGNYMNTEFLKEEMEARKRWERYDQAYRAWKRSGFDAFIYNESDHLDYMVEKNTIEKRNILPRGYTEISEGDIFQFKNVMPGENLYIDFHYPISIKDTLKKSYFTFVEVFHKDNEGILICKGFKRFNLSTLHKRLFCYIKDECGNLIRDEKWDTKSDGTVVDLYTRKENFNVAMLNISNKLIMVKDSRSRYIRRKIQENDESSLWTTVTDTCYTLDFI